MDMPHVEVLLRLCAVMIRGRLLPAVITSHLKDLALREDEELVQCVVGSNSKDLLSAVTNIAHGEAKRIMNELFKNETLEHTHLLASMGSAMMIKSSGYDSQALVYGEVDFGPFVEVLQEALKGIKRAIKFVDLGHGIGRAAIVAALTMDFDEILGFEVLKELHEKSESIVARYTSLTSDMCHTCFDLRCGSFLDPENVAEWIDADVIFANSTCFPDSLVAAIEELCKQTEPGTRIITFTSRFSSTTHFRVLYSKQQIMSWGYATVFVHEKLQVSDADDIMLQATMARQEARHRIESLLADINGGDDY